MEPSLGSLNHPGPTAQTHWGGGDATIDHDEVEDENEHAGDVLDESHDAREDDEYSLGWTEHTDQHKAGIVDAKTWNDPDGEPDLGSTAAAKAGRRARVWTIAKATTSGRSRRTGRNRLGCYGGRALF